MCALVGQIKNLIYLYSFFNLGARWGEWLASNLGRFTPGNDPIPIVWEAGWATGPLWMDAKMSPKPGLDPLTVRAVASRYNERRISGDPNARNELSRPFSTVYK
jgi:hypothetical protein